VAATETESMSRKSRFNLNTVKTQGSPFITGQLMDLIKNSRHHCCGGLPRYSDFEFRPMMICGGLVSAATTEIRYNGAIQLL